MFASNFFEVREIYLIAVSNGHIIQQMTKTFDRFPRNGYVMRNIRTAASMAPYVDLVVLYYSARENEPILDILRIPVAHECNSVVSEYGAFLNIYIGY